MERNTKFLFFFFVACAAAAGTVWGYQAQIAEADLTQEEVNTYITQYIQSISGKDYLLTQLGFLELEEDIGHLQVGLDALRATTNQRFDSQQKSHNHEEFTSISTSIANLNSQIAQLRSDIALLKVQKPSSSGGTSTTTDYDLELAHDLNFIEVDDTFDDGDVMYLRGYHNTNERNFEFVIFDPDGERYESGRVSMTQGNFLWTWQIPNNADRGVWTIVIEIDNVEDEIDFRVS